MTVKGHLTRSTAVQQARTAAVRTLQSKEPRRRTRRPALPRPTRRRSSALARRHGQGSAAPALLNAVHMRHLFRNIAARSCSLIL